MWRAPHLLDVDQQDREEEVPEDDRKDRAVY